VKGYGAEVLLRDIVDADVPIFFEHQRDPEASAMAAFPAREYDAHMAHWGRILVDETVCMRTIVVDGQVTGNVVSWEADGRRLVGYWIGREFWGRGIATRALAEFLAQVTERPLRAMVAPHNLGSIRVLEKCGFIRIAEDKEELTLELRPAPPATARTDPRRP
jgi:RimJ/RimL family protein N-acetyltransferase